MKNENKNEKTKYDLDLDKPKYRTGLTLGQWKELRQKDPSTLTPEQKTQLAEAEAMLKPVLEKLAQPLTSFINFSNEHSEAIKRIANSIRSLSDIKITVPSVEIPKPIHEIMEMSRPGLLPHDFVMPEIIPPANAEQQHKQTQVLEELVAEIKKQRNEIDSELHQAIRPRYMAKKRLLIFANTLVDIPAGNQHRLCCVLFRSERPVKNPVQLGDALEKMLLTPKDKKKIYSAKQAINTEVEKRTQFPEFLIIESSSVWFNKKYL